MINLVTGLIISPSCIYRTHACLILNFHEKKTHLTVGLFILRYHHINGIIRISYQILKFYSYIYPNILNFAFVN